MIDDMGTTCEECGYPLVRAKDGDGAEVLIESGASRTRGTLDLVRGGHPDGGLLVARLDEAELASRRAKHMPLYVDHTECPERKEGR